MLNSITTSGAGKHKGGVGIDFCALFVDSSYGKLPVVCCQWCAQIVEVIGDLRCQESAR